MTETHAQTRMSPQDAAAYLGTAEQPVSLNTLAWWRAQGRGPAYVKMGQRVQYLKADLDAFLSAGRRSPERRA